MSFYSRRIFPFLLDLTLGRKEIGVLREELLSGVKGRVLEVGIGSGLNLPHYPVGLRSLTAVDVNPGMRRKALKRMKASGLDVDYRILSGERLPFEDASFDSVVMTFTLCSLPDAEGALEEMRRVLRAGGRLYFLEHGLSEEPRVARWQRRLNPIQKMLGDGCHLDRDVLSLVKAAFHPLECRKFYFENVPKTHGYFYQGVAEKAAI